MTSPSTRDTRPLPHNIEAEQQLLGQILIKNATYYAVNSVMKPEYFREPLHQNIYQVASELIESGKACSPISIKTYLPEDAKIGEITLREYLGLLASNVAMMSPKDAAIVLIELHCRRELIQACRDAEEKAITPDTKTSLESIVGQLESDLSRIRRVLHQGEGDQIISMQQAMRENLEHISNAYQRDQAHGFDTKIGFVNELVGPFIPGQYIIIGAATKTGKSALAMQIAEGISVHKPVLYFSLEMNAKLMASRKMAAETSISTRRQRAGKVSSDEYERLSLTAEQIEGSHNLFITSEKMSIEQVFDTARRFRRLRGDIGAVVVDHLGILAKPKNMRTTSDWEIAANASPIMKDIAEELDCVTIGLSQLNKEDPTYGQKTMMSKINACMRKPNFNNLKGAIANDADHVIMPFRAQASLSKIEPAKGTEDWALWNVAMEENNGGGQIVLALSRESQWPKTVDVSWNGVRTSFETIVEEQHSFGEVFS